MTHVAVVGGGIAGLAAARELARRGVTVTLLESTDGTGGKLRTSTIAGIAVDEGAESFLLRVPEASDLVTAVGLGDQLVSPTTGAASVWARGALRPIPAGTVMGVPSDPSLLAGVLSEAEVERAELDRSLPGEPPAAADGGDVSVGQWLTERLGRAVVDRLVDPLLGGVYAGRADELSLAATLPQLPRDETSALAAARRALPAARPAGVAAAPVFGSVRSGLGAFAGAVTADLRDAGVTVLTKATVRRTERTATGWQVVCGPTTAERTITADALVLAVPPAPAARLLATECPVAATELAGVDTASVAIVTTAWRRTGAPAASGSGYLVPAEAGRPVKAVTFASTKWAHLGTPEIVVVRASLGRHRDVAVLQRDDADLVDLVVAELAEVAGFTGRPVEDRVTRWGGALPQYAVGHLGRVARIRAAVAAVPGLAVCGAAYDGVGIPACIRSALRAAGEVMRSVEVTSSATP